MLNQLLKSEPIKKGSSKILSQFLQNRRLLPSIFPQETINALMRLAKESLEQRLLSLKRESSDEEFKEVVALLHLLSTGTGQESLSQVAGLLIGHLETELKLEHVRLNERVGNLKSYVISFDTNDDSGYTLLFADALLNGLGVFFSVLELERGLKVFSADKQNETNKTSEGFSRQIGMELAKFVKWVISSSETFFEVDHQKLSEAQKQLFIIVDDPSLSAKTPNKFEWPEIRKLETFLKESCLIIQQTRLFLEEIDGLYQDEDKPIYNWITEEMRNEYLLKACQTQSLGNIFKLIIGSGVNFEMRIEFKD
jgi:hypothetical protein